MTLSHMPSTGPEANVQYVSGQGNKQMSKHAHCLTSETVVEELSANSRDGLTMSEANSRQEDYGRNELDDGPGVQPLKILLRQIANAMMLVKPTASCIPGERW